MTKTFRFLGMVLMAVLIGAGLTACSDDDDVSASDIVGKWYMEGEDDYYIVFSSDGTGYEYSEGSTGRFEYSLSGSTLHIVWHDGSDDVVDLSVKISGDKMTCRNLTDDTGWFTLLRAD